MPPSPPRNRAELESRASVAVTVAWMLACLCSAVASAATLLIWGILSAFPAGPQSPLAAIAPVMLLTAALTGLFCLVLTPLAVRIRRIPPPRAITIAAILIGLAPLILLAIRALLHSSATDA